MLPENDIESVKPSKDRVKWLIEGVRLSFYFLVGLYAVVIGFEILKPQINYLAGSLILFYGIIRLIRSILAYRKEKQEKV